MPQNTKKLRLLQKRLREIKRVKRLVPNASNIGRYSSGSVSCGITGNLCRLDLAYEKGSNMYVTACVLWLVNICVCMVNVIQGHHNPKNLSFQPYWFKHLQTSDDVAYFVITLILNTRLQSLHQMSSWTSTPWRHQRWQQQHLSYSTIYILPTSRPALPPTPYTWTYSLCSMYLFSVYTSCKPKSKYTL